MPTKKDGKWLVDVRPDGARGKRIRRTFDTQGEARRFEAYILGQAAQGLPWNPTPADLRPFSEIISLWYKSHGQHLTDGKRRLAVLESIAAAMGDPALCELTAAHFTDYRAEKSVRGKPAKPKTLNNHLGYCNAVFNELRSTGAIAIANPFAAVKLIDIPENELFWLTAEQITEVLREAAASVNPDLYWLCRTCLETGGRWGETEALTLRRVRNQSVTFTDTKGKRNRTIPISADLEKGLLQHAKKMGRTTRVFGSSRLAFSYMKNHRLSFDIPAGQATHVLRHTFASHFMMNGGGIVSLQKILGHVDIKSTMVYIHLAPGHLDQALTFNPLAGLKVDTPA